MLERRAEDLLTPGRILGTRRYRFSSIRRGEISNSFIINYAHSFSQNCILFILRLCWSRVFGRLINYQHLMLKAKKVLFWVKSDN